MCSLNKGGNEERAGAPALPHPKGGSGGPQLAPREGGKGQGCRQDRRITVGGWRLDAGEMGGLILQRYKVVS